MNRTCIILLAGIALASSVWPIHAADVSQLTETINNIGSDGKGYPEAVAAMESLSQLDQSSVPSILAAIDEERPVSANWLRGAVEAIAQKAQQSGNPVTSETLVRFIESDKHSPKSRSVAFHLLKQQDPPTADSLVPSFTKDASLELRLLAVERLMNQASALAEKEQATDAIATYKAALDATRNAYQAQQIADALEKLNVEVDTTEHFGFVKSWHLIAPFEFAKGDGFDATYPPEQEIDLTARYPGKLVDEVPGPAAWKKVDLGSGKKRVDFNKTFAPVKEVVGYAVTTFDSDKPQQVELRWGSPNATKVWVNGKLIAADKVYHAGDNFDQYSASAKLKAGENTILVKVVQNEQTQSWTNVWHFELRVCDHLGTAIRDVKP